MPESPESLHAELARLMSLITQAREAGNSELADQITEKAARCLMEIAGVPLTDSPQRPVAQQQQQIQPKKKDE